MVDSERAELMRAIASHLRDNGAGNWNKLQGRFPLVPAATFWRYVRKVRTSETDRIALGQARQRLADHVALQVHNAADQQISGAELPSVASGWKQLNLLRHLEQAFADIDALRAFARSEGQISHPHFFAQTIGMRDRTVATALRCAESIWDVQRMWDFYDVLVEEVASESPEVARRITQRFRDVAKERGIG